MKALIKRFLRFFSLTLTLPLFLFYRLSGFIGNRDSSFQSISQLISLLPGKPGIYIRAAFYYLACPNTSHDISIGFLTIFSHWDTTILSGVYIGPQCNIGKCMIGEDTLIGSGVHVLSGKRQHSFSNPTQPIKHQKGHFEKLSIGRDCWLGNNAVIMASIAPRTIVGAGSVVTTPTQTATIVGGNPGGVIGHRETRD